MSAKDQGDRTSSHTEGADNPLDGYPHALNETEVEALARAAHHEFCKWLRDQGYSYGTTTDQEKKTHRSLLDYEDLEEGIKQANRDNVQDIPKKLAAAGYTMRPGEEEETTPNFPGSDLDRLARMEHARWTANLRRSGWTYGPELNPERREHPALVLWEELDEQEREKDRQMIRVIPKILASIGYQVVQRAEPSPE